MPQQLLRGQESVSLKRERHLGAALGTNSFVDSYVQKKVSEWVREIE